MKKYKFKILKNEMRKGYIVYECSIGFFIIGHVKIIPKLDKIFITSKKESMVEEIKEAYYKFEKTEEIEELKGQECG